MRGLGFPDFKKVAAAYRLATDEIPNHENLNKNIRRVLNCQGPILCDVRVSPDQKIMPKLKFGRPIEDMDPLLPRGEYEANMNCSP